MPHIAACPTASTPDLAPLEASLLWAMRAWAIGCRRRECVQAPLTRLFHRLGAPLGLGYLNGMMWALNGGAQRMLDVNCVCHDAVSADETLLLDAIALSQAGQEPDARALLGTLLSRGAARVAAQSASGLAVQLRHAGQLLPRQGEALRRHALAARYGAGSALVH